ncbi:cytochrome P450 [Hypomontagnella monticulosa]|nr:cytochrome P450 [Hypomontagnella monticulosa]
MEAIIEFVNERGPILASVGIILITVFCATFLWGANDASSLPLIGEEYGNADKRMKAFMTSGQELYKKGYELFKSKAWRITTLDGDHIVLPHHLLDEVSQLPDDVIDIHKAFEITNELKYLEVGQNRSLSNLVTHVVRSELTRGLGRINSTLAEEVERTIHGELPLCNDFTPVVIHQAMLRIIAIVSGSIFIGTEYCRAEEYLNASIGYTISFIHAATGIRKWHPWMRWIGRYFTPEITVLYEERKKARKFLEPIIKQRRADEKAGKKAPDNVLQWMLNKAGEYGVADLDVADGQLSLSMASIHTTSLTLTMLLYDIVVRPQLIEDLRNEIKTVLTTNNGILSHHALFEMKLLDSTMKESLRANPGRLARFQRWVAKSVTLSDGTYLPAGYMVEAAHALAVQDPNMYRNPEKFEPRRFLDLRNGTAEDPLGYKNKEQYQFSTVTKDFMHFGFGRHSCPGRFFAANEIKLIIARILMDYDIRMPDGLTERYANIEKSTGSFPDPTKTILFKRVETPVKTV